MAGVVEQNVFTETKVDKQNKVLSLFEFIRELNKLKRRTILNVKDYQWSFTLSKLPNDPDNINVFYRDRVEEETFDDNNGDNILLSVHKPEFQKCPEPDKVFINWLLPNWDSFRNDVSVKPFVILETSKEELLLNSTLKDIHSTEKENVQEEELYKENFSDDILRVKEYEKWLVMREEWVKRQRIIEKTRLLFTDLYRLYYELQRESETKEIIVANGILCDAKNHIIKHPVLTHRVKLDYDPDENTVYILDTDITSELYSVVFQMMEDVNLGGINKLSEDLQNNDYHPLDRNDTPDFLRILIHQLSPSSMFSQNGIPTNWSAESRLLLYMEPCYIVRNRLDGTLKAIEQIIENVKETGEIPAPIVDIVSGGTIEVPNDLGEESIEEQLAAVGGESIDVLLSKEANKEQLEIARRIEQYNAVLVQGPPGTGKTHTIANLMGHFLAQGKSVLVTSYTKKALNVLKDKVVPGLQSLCVSVLVHYFPISWTFPIMSRF